MKKAGDRLRQTLNQEEPESLPYDLGANDNTGIHIQAYRSLKNYMNMDSNNLTIKDRISQRAEVEKEIKNRLGFDVDGIYPQPPAGWQFRPYQNDKYRLFEDEFGITWRMPRDNGYYYDMYEHPLANIDTVEDIINYEFYDADDPARFNKFTKQLNESRKESRPFVLNGHAGIFELALWLRGFSQFYMDLASDPKKAEALLDKLLRFKKQYWRKALSFTEDELVIVAEADDLAGEESTLISPEMYRKYIKPRHQKLFDFIKKEAEGEIYIFYHSCGAVKELIPDLIEEGIDILNPVQISADNMNLKQLKQEFGQDITFWGGGVDTQATLPYGSPEAVKEEVKRNIETLAPGGGFVFAAVHNVQADVPPENFMAMWETLQDYRN